MHLLAIAGFLGSGKTTAIVGLAEAVKGSDFKTAIIVNEIGQIGVDDQVLRQLDIDVWELLSGCICCSLTGDLLQALDKLDRDHNIDLVLLEPSGTANPRQIVDALQKPSGAAIDRVKIVVIVDPLRLSGLMEVLSPLIHSQIELADLIIVTKTDIATAESVEHAIQTARRINKRAPFVSTALKDGLSPRLKKELLPWLR